MALDNAYYETLLDLGYGEENLQDLADLAWWLTTEYPELNSFERGRICEKLGELFFETRSVEADSWRERVRRAAPKGVQPATMIPGYESSYRRAGSPIPHMWVHQWRTPVMPCSAFYYYKSEGEARKAHHQFLALYTSLHRESK